MNNKLSVCLEVWADGGADGVPRELAESVSFELALWAQQARDQPWVVCPRFTETSSRSDRVYFEIRLVHMTVTKDSARRVEVFRKLCKAILSASSDFKVVSIPRDNGLKLKPTSRGTLASIDLDFGGAFCIALIERSKTDILRPVIDRPVAADVTTRNVTRWLQAPIHVAISAADIAVWLEPHITILRSLMEKDPREDRGGGGDDGVDIVPVLSALQFFCRVSPLMKSLASTDTNGKKTTACQATEQHDGNALQDFKGAADRALIALHNLKDGGPVDLRRVEKTTKELNKLKLAASTSAQIAQYRKDEAVGDVVFNAACTGLLGGMAASAFYSPISMIPAFAKYMMVAGGTLGVVLTAKAASDYATASRTNKTSQDILETSHRMWLFMTLFFLRSQGMVSRDDENFRNLANRMAYTFTGSDVVANWGGLSFVTTWLDVEIQRLENGLNTLLKTRGP